jgi:hypothetical protein
LYRWDNPLRIVAKADFSALTCAYAR